MVGIRSCFFSSYFTYRDDGLSQLSYVMHPRMGQKWEKSKTRKIKESWRIKRFNNFQAFYKIRWLPVRPLRKIQACQNCPIDIKFSITIYKVQCRRSSNSIIITHVLFRHVDFCDILKLNFKWNDCHITSFLS